MTIFGNHSLPRACQAGLPLLETSLLQLQFTLRSQGMNPRLLLSLVSDG